MRSETKAILYLVLVTAIWGLTFPLIRNAVAVMHPLAFVAIRFSLSAITLLPLVWHKLRNTTSRLLIYSVILGILNAATYISQTIGLETISSARSAFITGVNVILVPFFNPLFRLGKPTWLEISCSIICLLGLDILTGAHLGSISKGDQWTLLCAITTALALCFLKRITSHTPEYKLLTFYPILLIGPFAYLWSDHQSYRVLFNTNVIIAILFCAIIATSVALYLQTKYIKFTSASKAALIFALEPLFASIFGYVINGEIITINTWIGGSLILFSLMLPTFLSFTQNKTPP